MIELSRLENFYYDQGLSDLEIARRESVSRRTVTRWRNLLGVKSKRQVLAETLPPQLTDLQDQVLIGTLMGDGHLMSRRKDQSTARLTLTHSRKQKPYLIQKMEVLEPYTCHVWDYVDQKNGKEFLMSGGYTHYHRVFAAYHDLFYWSGEKTFDRIWDRVGPTALAYWFFDDGSIEGTGFRIVVSSKRRSDALAAVSVLRNKFGLNVTFREAYGTSGVDQIRICTDSADRFWRFLQPHLPECLSYKIPTGLSGNSEPSLVGNDLEGVTTTKVPTSKDMGSSRLLEGDLEKAAQGILPGNAGDDDIV
jgi:recombination protein RecA